LSIANHPSNGRNSFAIKWYDCPSCHKSEVYLLRGVYDSNNNFKEESRELVFPETTGREPIAKEVPKSLADEYREACFVIKKSPKASAAISRRILQSLLRDYAKVKRGDFADEIQEVLDRKELPSNLTKAVDAIRVIGNFATHPSKSKQTGEIVAVETGEAEWLLDIIEALFDYYFVLPSRVDERRDKLNKKLRGLGSLRCGSSKHANEMPRRRRNEPLYMANCPPISETYKSK